MIKERQTQKYEEIRSKEVRRKIEVKETKEPQHYYNFQSLESLEICLLKR